MAIYNLTVKLIKRSEGRSATAAAAYRAAHRIKDERTGELHDYTKKCGVVHREIFTPDNAPDWMKIREKLWNAVEKIEHRKDAQLSREIQLALPCELTDSQRLELVKGFIQEQFLARGMVADLCIHKPEGRARGVGGAATRTYKEPDNRNYHAHIMLTLRELLGDGFGQKNRDWNQKPLLESWREQWALHVNLAMEKAGHKERVDHRSYEAQGLDLQPEPKMGKDATQMEQRGKKTRVGDERRRIKAENVIRLEVMELVKQARTLKQEEMRLKSRLIGQRFKQVTAKKKAKAEAQTDNKQKEPEEKPQKLQPVRMNPTLAQIDMRHAIRNEKTAEAQLEKLNRLGYRVVLDDKKEAVILDPTGGRHTADKAGLNEEQQQKLADTVKNREPQKATPDQLNPIWREQLAERQGLREKQQAEKRHLEEKIYQYGEKQKTALKDTQSQRMQDWQQQTSQHFDKREAQGAGRLVGKFFAGNAVNELQQQKQELKSQHQQERKDLQEQLKTQREHHLKQLEAHHQQQSKEQERTQEKETLQARQLARQDKPIEEIRQNYLDRKVKQPERKPEQPQPDPKDIQSKRETVNKDMASIWQQSQTPDRFREGLQQRGYQLAESQQGKQVVLDPTGKPHLVNPEKAQLPPELMPHLQNGQILREVQKPNDPLLQQQFAERAQLLHNQQVQQEQLKQGQEKQATQQREHLAERQQNELKASDDRINWGTGRMGQIGYLREGWSSLSSWTKAEHQLVQQEYKEAREERQAMEQAHGQQKEHLEKAIDRRQTTENLTQQQEHNAEWRMSEQAQQKERNQRDLERSHEARKDDQKLDPEKKSRGLEPSLETRKDPADDQKSRDLEEEERKRKNRSRDMDR